MEYKIVRLAGGLGNQMFQYAFAKSLEYHLQIPILLDKSWYEAEYAMHFGLDIFKIDLPYATQEQIEDVKEKISDFEKKPKIIRSILKRLSFPRSTCSSAFEYREEYLKPNSFIYFKGYFQNPLYFQSISSQIKQDMSPPPIKSEINKHKLQQILSSGNSVFIHIRRGDYLTHSWEIDLEYYKKAVAIIASKVENPQFFLFCADREFAEHLDLDYPFIDMTTQGINADNHFEDLTLMAHCRHGIVANSTYSWWAAYLMNNPYKIIIAPTPWLLGSDAIICKDWVKIEVKGVS